MRARREAAQARAMEQWAFRSWEVQRGDDFRSIAGQVLRETWGRAPTAAEVESYRRMLIELNRDRLPDRERPDVLRKGQILLMAQVPRPGTF